MHQLLEFVSHHWLLVAAFVVALIALIIIEARGQGLMSGNSRLTPSRAVQLINKDKAIVLDIRPEAKFSQGHILQAIHLPMTELNQKLSLIEKYKKRPLLIVCDAGNKAPTMAAQLKKAGFSEIYILTGGLQAWEKAGLPLTQVKKTS